MTRGVRLLPFLILLVVVARAQELFIHNEPASSIPKRTLGVRLFGETYNEYGAQRNMAGLKLMYGITPRLSVYVSGTASNHHSKNLPVNLVTHTHTGGGTQYQTGTIPRGLQYPYRINGVNLYAKYRFYTNDGQNTHLRMAAYGEAAYNDVAHDETEPNLVDDTGGFGGGLLCTYLSHHFATSLTAGFIVPRAYSETVPDFFGGMQHTKLSYGNALVYNLAFGYLLLPRHYKNYKQPNLNVYLELLGKAYETAKVQQNNNEVVPQTPLLQAGNYVEAHPGVQGIFNSNLRVDFSVGFPLLNKSVARFYPIYMFGVQRYFTL